MGRYDPLLGGRGFVSLVPDELTHFEVNIPIRQAGKYDNNSDCNDSVGDSSEKLSDNGSDDEHSDIKPHNKSHISNKSHIFKVLRFKT